MKSAFVSAIALAVVANASATYLANDGYEGLPTTCAAYTCPAGWVAKVDSGFGVCSGPCRPQDCCVKNKYPPVIDPIGPIHPIAPTPVPEAPKCVPLRHGAEGKCVVKGEFDAETGEHELIVGSSCTDAPLFCGCELKTADNKCVAVNDDDAVVLRDCAIPADNAQTWSFLANATGKFYFRNADNLYISADEDNVLVATDVEDAGYFYVESPCKATLEGPAPTPAPVPVPTAQTCGQWAQRYQCGGYGTMTKYLNSVCGNDKQCLMTCCEASKPEPTKPTCKIACPPGTVLSDNYPCKCVKKY